PSSAGYPTARALRSASTGSSRWRRAFGPSPRRSRSRTAPERRGRTFRRSPCSSDWNGPAEGVSVLHARHVLSGPRIDSHALALLYELRDPDLGAGLVVRGLHAALGGIAAHAGVRLDDLQLDVVLRSHQQRLAVPQSDHAGILLLESLGGIAHRVLAGGELLVGVGHHEVPEFAVRVEILHVLVDDVGGLDRVAGLERLVDDAPGLQVADLDPVERLALAGLHELV